MFPTTLWTSIHKAGEADTQALDVFARDYRPPILAYIRARGVSPAEAEDVCQDAFVRILSGEVLGKADANRGRFRSLILTVVQRTIQDRWRREATRREKLEELPLEHDPADRDPDFDRRWILHLAERAMTRLAEQDSPYYPVLREHLAGRSQDRNRLWNARKKLIALIRAEISNTCSSHAEFETEVAYLSGFLRPGKKA